MPVGAFISFQFASSDKRPQEARNSTFELCEPAPHKIRAHQSFVYLRLFVVALWEANIIPSVLFEKICVFVNENHFTCFRMAKAIVIFSIASVVLAYFTFRFITEEEKVARKSHGVRNLWHSLRWMFQRQGTLAEVRRMKTTKPYGPFTSTCLPKNLR